MIRRLEFTVLGEPQPQGSKTVVERRGRRPVVREDNPGTKPWRQAVTAAALDAVADAPPLAGPLRLTATFVFLRPAGHYGTGRNHGRLKASAPNYVPKRPDVDKLLRAIGDALAGVAFRDDAQLVVVHAEKHYGAPAAAHVVVCELEPDDDRPLTATDVIPTIPVDIEARRRNVTETPTPEPTEPQPPDPDDDE